MFCFLVLCFLHARGAGENDSGNARLPAGNAATPLTIYVIKGSSGVGMIRLFEEPPQISGFSVKMEALAQQDLMAARFIAGDAKVGILPPNMAAKIASSGRDIRAAAVLGEGMLSLFSADPGIRSIGDLRGKTVEVAGQGATPDYVFRRILTSHDLVPDRDLKLGYSLAPPEIAQALIAGRVSLALLPEPFATMALLGKPDLRSIADIQAEWTGTQGRNFPMTVLAVDGAFATANSAAFREILASVKNSVEWVKGHPAEAGALVEKHGLGIGATVAAAAIPKSGYVFTPASDARPALESLFNVFLMNSPVSIGGMLPADRFYWK